MKWRQVAIWLVLLTVVLAGCGKENDSSSDDPSKKGSATGKKTTYYAPLTGLETEEETTEPPVVATISNDPKARPQSGLKEADYSYEFLVEGGGTRYVSIYQSEIPSVIGPIRSARHYFLPIARDIGGFYIAHGYSPYAKKKLDEHYVDHINGMQHDGTLFFRSAERRAPHNSYMTKSSVEDAILRERISDHWSRPVALPFYKEDEREDVTVDAPYFTVRFDDDHAQYVTSYTFDEDEGVYKRSVGGVEEIDATSGERTSYANVLVITAPYTTIDAEGRKDVILTGGQEGYFFQNGTYERVTWIYDKGIVQPMKDGQEVPFERGKTFVHVVPQKWSIDQFVTIPLPIE